jgi:hypothetical protein
MFFSNLRQNNTMKKIQNVKKIQFFGAKNAKTLRILRNFHLKEGSGHWPEQTNIGKRTNVIWKSLLECYMWLSASKATFQETQKQFSALFLELDNK